LTAEQRWRPRTTCDCTVVERYDTADFEGTRALVRFEAKCPLHTSLSDADAYAALRDENPRWMKAFMELTEVLGVRPGMDRKASDAWYAEHMDELYEARYSPARELEVTVKAVLSGPERTRVATALTTRLGKVRLV